MSSFEFLATGTDIAVISFHSAALVAFLVIAILCCVYAKKFAPFSRPHGLSGVASAAGFGPVTFALEIAWVVARYEGYNTYSSNSLIHLAAVYNLFYHTLCGMILLAQYEMAVGLYQVNKGRLPSVKPMPVARMIGAAAVVVYMIIVIAYFAVYESIITSDYATSSLFGDDDADYQTYYDLNKAFYGLSFTIAVLLFAASFAIIIHTSMAPRVPGARRARGILIGAASIGLVMFLYQLIVSGIFDLQIFTMLGLWYPEWLPALTSVFTVLPLSIILILLFSAGVTSSKSDPVWNGQQPGPMAYQPVAGYGQPAMYPQQPHTSYHPQQPWPQRDSVYPAPVPQQQQGGYPTGPAPAPVASPVSPEQSTSTPDHVHRS